MIRVLLFLVASAVPGALAAQVSSLEELQAQVDAQSAEIEGFRRLLNDPDPNRAIAAMRAMLESGDALLENLALEAGLTSTVGAMRKTALSGYLATGPTLQVDVTLQDTDIAEPEKFQSWISNYASLSGEKSGVLMLTIGKKLENENCYTTASSCTIWPTADGLAFLHQGVRGSLRLAEDGALVGTMGGGATGGPVGLRADLLAAGPVQ